MNMIQSFSEMETFHLGQKLAEEAKSGDLFCLLGDLGTGKTVLAKGMAEGLKIGQRIQSPTFMIVREYKDGTLPFYHFDLYRLEDEDELYAIGWEEYLGKEGIILVEWADLMPDAMPKEAKWIRIEKDLSKGTDYRKILIGTYQEIAGE